jgi:hypothetical protein
MVRMVPERARITSEHQLWKLRAYSSVNFDSAS